MTVKNACDIESSILDYDDTHIVQTLCYEKISSSIKTNALILNATKE